MIVRTSPVWGGEMVMRHCCSLPLQVGAERTMSGNSRCSLTITSRIRRPARSEAEALNVRLFNVERRVRRPE